MDTSQRAREVATVSTSMARMLLRAMREASLDVARLCEAAGVDRAHVDDPDARLPYPSYMHLWTLAGSARPGIGLFVAEQFMEAASLGILGFTASHCRTFAESVERAVQFIQLVNENTFVQLDRTSDAGIVTDVPRDPDERWPVSHAEMAIGAFAALGRKWTGRDVRPLWATFQHPRPDHHPMYRRLFGDDVRFGQAKNRIALPNALLDAPVVGADPELTRYLDRQAAHLMQRLEKEPLLPRLRRWVGEVLPEGAPDLAAAARAFGMSARTLQRRLMEGGTRFDRIVDAERRRLALAALAEEGVSVHDAAMRAGYTDPSAFRDAVRRWTGCAPSELRRRTAVS